MRNVNLKPQELHDLLLEIWKRSKRARLTLTGPSMSPTIFTGDAVELCPVEGELSVGEIGLFQAQSGHLYVHRLIRVESGVIKKYIFKGDGLTLADLPVPAEKILGRVTAVWRQTSPYSYRLPLRIPGLMRAISFYHRLRPWVLILQRKLSVYIA